MTKRWWTCAGCNHRFSTLGVKYPTKRCPNARYVHVHSANPDMHANDDVSRGADSVV